MPRAFLIAKEILKNLAMGVPAVARARAARGRTASPRLAAELLERQAWEPFAVLSAAVPTLAGKDVAEIGPGDLLCVALLALGDGAKSYTALDRFLGPVGSPHARRVYARLVKECQKREPAIAAELDRRGIAAKGFPGPWVRHEGTPIEALGERAVFDVVFSHNVVEHLTDVRAMARGTFEALRPGGVAVHRVDFGPHDLWVRRADPLEWLTIPEPVWRWMGSNRGTPNRLRLHEVVLALEEAGFAVESEVGERFPEAWVERLGRRRRWARVPTESLAARTATLVCRR